MHPGARALESDDGIAGRREQLAVVGDHQDRLARRADQRLELTLGRDVEEVVGLVEEQHLSVGGEQQLEHQALALSAGQRGRGPVADFVEPGARDAPAGRVPPAFELVAPQLGPRADRLPQPHSGVIITRRQLALGAQHRRADLAHPLGRHREQ